MGKSVSVRSRALVTGANGFIGGHLVRALLSQGVAVRAAVRSREAVTAFGTHVETVVVGDIGSQTDWSHAVEGVDVVYHLAARAHRLGVAEQRSEDAYREVNALGSAKLALQCAEARSVRRLVYVSSIAAREAEELSATGRSSYATSKHEAEQAIREALKNGPPDWTIVRPPLVYGPGNPGNMERLLQLLRIPVPLPLGGITNRRSFLFVGNLADFLVQVAESDRASRQTFEVADDESVSTPELIRLIGQISDRRTRLFAVPDGALRAIARCGDMLTFVTGRRAPFDTYSVDRLVNSLIVDSSRARELLSWHPPFTLRDGLRATLLSRAGVERTTDH